MNAEQEYSPEQLELWESRAPGWRIRCLKCGRADPYGKYGIRKSGAGRLYTIGYCPQCHWVRFYVVEKVKPA